MKKIFCLSTLICLLLIGTVFAIKPLRGDFDINNGLGRVEGADDHGHVIMTINKGWNLLPLRFIMDASGRYWGNYKEGQTCNQDVFQSVWYYSPASRDYYHIPVIDDWGAPGSRNNDFLLNEFLAKYYHIHAGSAWLYSPDMCILETDSGVELIFESFHDGDRSHYFKKEELILKSGWNFIPMNMRMYVFERNPYELLQDCSPSKFYGWNSRIQKWEALTDEIMEVIRTGEYDTPQTSNIFETILVKTNRDCYFADFDQTSGSAPPAIPN